MAKCGSCPASIVWAVTEKGKAMPLDMEPAPNGNIRIVDGVAVYVTKARPAAEGERLYLSHFVTCPNAKQHRKAG